MAPRIVEQGCIQVLSHTTNSVVYAVDTEATPGRAGDTPTVLKGWAVWYKGEEPVGPVRPPEMADAMVRAEAAIYDALEKHDRILNHIGLEVAVLKGTGPELMAWAMRLERAPGPNLRKYLYDNLNSPPGERAQLELALQFAEGVAYVHSRGVVWNDLSTRNALLFDGWRLKLSDFGSSILYDDRNPKWWGAEIRYNPPGPQADHDYRTDIEVDTIQREIFALGSAIYEITEWKVPYGSDDEVTLEEVEEMLIAGKWPELSNNNPAKDIIRLCWDFKYESAHQVFEDLKGLLKTGATPQGHDTSTQ